MYKNNFIKTTLTSIIALCFITISSMASANEKPKMEKCMGIVKAGKADGQTTVNGKKEDWIYVPVSACAKFVGGRVLFDK